MRWRPTDLITPTRYLSVVNVLSSALGMAQGIIVLRGLGPELVGVIAVVSGINATVLNFLDVRLTDLASKLYYQTTGLDEPAQRAQRASVLLLCVGGNALVSVLLGAAGWLASLLFIRLFTDAPVAWWWLGAQALVLGFGNVGNTLGFLQRLSGRFYYFGTVRLAIHAASFTIFILIFLTVGAVDGYYRAAFSSGLLSLSMTALATVYVWVRKEHLPIFAARFWRALPYYRQHLRFLFYGNLLGYTKLLHRAADTLVVGFFADDRITGLYKFARSLTDSLYALFDAMNQVYQPRFLELLAANKPRDYRRLATRIFAVCAVFTTVTVCAEFLLLRPLLGFLFGAKYSGSELAIVAMTVPFLFVAGIYTWLWPLFIHSGRLGSFTAVATLSALVQVAVTVGTFALIGKIAAAPAIGYLSFYLVLYPIAYFIVRKRHPACVPGVG